MFKIVVVGWKAENYIKNCLNSLLNQKEKNWQCCVVLDPSGDKTYEQAKEYESEKIKVILNENRCYAIQNIVKSISSMSPEDQDIIVLLDADDWLYDHRVLSIVMYYYRCNPQILATHGSWVSYPNQIKTNNGPYTEEEFKIGVRNINLVNWKGSHLKTFKYKVYKHINHDHFKMPNGEWMKSSYDLCLMFPIFEMAGFGRIKYIPDYTYVYNRETCFNDDKIDPAMQDECTNYLVKLPKYNMLEY